MKRALLPIFLVLFLMVSYSVAQKTPQTQTSFCDDDAPDDVRLKPVVLPKAVLTALLNTKQAREERRYADNEGKNSDLAKLFRGARISLAESTDAFFLVIGKSPLSGADNTWFWIVKQTGHEASVLLWAGANCLNIEPSMTLGLRNISTHWASASTTVTESFVYDGKAYKPRKRTSHPVSWR